jgi:hypothetical protein
MTLLYKLAICLACCYFSNICIYAQKIVQDKERYNQYLAFQLISEADNKEILSHTNHPIVKFSLDETFNLSLEKMNSKQHLKKAILNFSSQNLINSKIIAAPIDPASPLQHDDSHVLALLFHARTMFPLLLKFALYF